MTTFVAKDDGFTLAEAIMSLLVVGLALGSLIQVASQSAKAQTRLTVHQKQTKVLEQQSARLRATLSKAVPTKDGYLVGHSDYVSAKDQSGRDHLYRVPHGWRLTYVSQGEVSGQWPSEADENLIGEHPRLEAVILSDAQKTPVAVVKLRLEQAVDCQFDMISRRCREAG